jgi:hypothetical protein
MLLGYCARHHCFVFLVIVRFSLRFNDELSMKSICIYSSSSTMKDKQPNLIPTDKGTENRGYIRSQSDNQLTSFKEELHAKNILRIPPILRANSAAASTFPIIYELPNDVKHSDSMPLPSPCPPPNYSLCQSTTVGVFDRRYSLLDPMSDRVSTILVWQNITVSTHENERKGIMKHLQQTKFKESERKRLLHNISGAITGGLWAVMGE